MFLLLSLFLTNPVFSDEALDRAVEAGYVQVGMRDNVDRFVGYVSNNYINKDVVLRNISGLVLIYRNRCVKMGKLDVGLQSESYFMRYKIDL